MRVLIIDPSPHAGQQMERTLHARGIQVHQAETLCEGVRWLLLNAADAILVDARLPGLSGPGDLRPLTEIAGAAPVLVVVGERATGLAEAYRRRGLLTLPRPLDIEALVLMLGRLAAPAGTGRNAPLS